MPYLFRRLLQTSTHLLRAHILQAVHPPTLHKKLAKPITREHLPPLQDGNRCRQDQPWPLGYKNYQLTLSHMSCLRVPLARRKPATRCALQILVQIEISGGKSGKGFQGIRLLSVGIPGEGWCCEIEIEWKFAKRITYFQSRRQESATSPWNQGNAAWIK